MEGLDVVELIFNKVSDTGITGYMDVKPKNDHPEVYFTVSHISTNNRQFANDIPVNIRVYAKKTESGMPRRDLLKTTMQQIQTSFEGISVSGFYFSAEKLFTSMFLDEPEYDILVTRYDVIVKR